MTAFNLKPKFTDKAGYLQWRGVWSETYKRCQQDILRRKHRVKQCQRALVIYRAFLFSNGELPTPHCTVVSNAQALEALQRELIHFRSVGRKMMTLLGEGLARRDRIIAMQAAVAAQPFPLDLGACQRVDFHFNRGHNEFPFLPMWVIRAKGKSYYVNEVEASVPWTTKARENGSTKGVMRFPSCSVEIDSTGVAKLGAT